MRKFNIRKVLDGLTAVSSAASASSSSQQQQAGNRESDIQETLQSEHFQLCKVNGAALRGPVGYRSRAGREGWEGKGGGCVCPGLGGGLAAAITPGELQGPSPSGQRDACGLGVTAGWLRVAALPS